jgi:hypothetical protein
MFRRLGASQKPDTIRKRFAIDRNLCQWSRGLGCASDSTPDIRVWLTNANQIARGNQTKPMVEHLSR